MRWDAARALGSTEKVALTVEGEPVLALPLWVAVHQDSEGGLARCAFALCNLGLRVPFPRHDLGCLRLHEYHLVLLQDKGVIAVRSSLM